MPGPQIRKILRLLVVVASLVAAAADNPASWRKKPIAEWNEEDAKQVLTNSTCALGKRGSRAARPRSSIDEMQFAGNLEF